MTGPKSGAAVAKAAKFFRAKPGPDGTVVLALATPDGVEAFILRGDDASNAAVTMLQIASSDPADPMVYPADGVSLEVSEESTLVLRFSLAGAFLPLSLEAKDVAALRAALDEMPDAPPAPRPSQAH